MRIAILDDYQNAAYAMADWSRLADCHLDNSRQHFSQPGALEDFLADAEVVVAMRERTAFSAATFDALPKLRLLVTTGMVNASIDMEAAAARSIVVCGTPGGGTATAELAFGLLLSLARNIPGEVAAFREGNAQWQQSVGIELAGRRLAIAGFGRLGKSMAGYGQAFGMKVSAWSRSLTEDEAQQSGIRRSASLDDLLGEADVLSLHLPLNDNTRGLLDADRLARLPRGSILLNTSRGQLVDEAALIEALSSGQIGGAGLDVFDTEPLPLNHPLRQLPNVIATPHLGYVTEEVYRKYFEGAVDAIVAWRSGSPIRVLNGFDETKHALRPFA